VHAAVQTDTTPPGRLHILCQEYTFDVRVTIITEKKQRVLQILGVYLWP